MSGSNILNTGPRHAFIILILDAYLTYRLHYAHQRLFFDSGWVTQAWPISRCTQPGVYTIASSSLEHRDKYLGGLKIGEDLIRNWWLCEIANTDLLHLYAWHIGDDGDNDGYVDAAEEQVEEE